jgi:hypothetical protein
MRSSFRTGLVLGGGSLVCSLPGGGGEGSGLLGFMGERGETGVCRVVMGEEVSEDCSLFVRCGRFLPVWCQKSLSWRRKVGFRRDLSKQTTRRRNT